MKIRWSLSLCPRPWGWKISVKTNDFSPLLHLLLAWMDDNFQFQFISIKRRWTIMWLVLTKRFAFIFFSVMENIYHSLHCLRSFFHFPFIHLNFVHLIRLYFGNQNFLSCGYSFVVVIIYTNFILMCIYVWQGRSENLNPFQFKFF